MKLRNVVIILIVMVIVLMATNCYILFAYNNRINDVDDLKVVYADGIVSRNSLFEINPDGQARFIMIDADSIYQNGTYMAISDIELNGDILTIHKVNGEEIKCKVLLNSQQKQASE